MVVVGGNGREEVKGTIRLPSSTKCVNQTPQFILYFFFKCLFISGCVFHLTTSWQPHLVSSFLFSAISKRRKS